MTSYLGSVATVDAAPPPSADVFQPVTQYASNASLNTYLLHDQSGTVGQRFDPGQPNDAWFDNVHYVSATGASSGDGLTVGAPVSIFRAWDIARTHRAAAESALFKCADGNYRMGTTVGVNSGLGGAGRLIEAEVTPNYEKPILFIGTGSGFNFDCNIGSGRGEPLYIGGATNMHFWRWNALNGNAGVHFGAVGLGFNNDVMGPLIDCTFRYFTISSAAGSLCDIKSDHRRLILSDFLIEDSGVSTRTDPNTSAFGEGFYHGHGGLGEGFDSSVGGNNLFRNVTAHNIPAYTGPLDTVLLRGEIRDINGGEAIDSKPFGQVHAKDVWCHDIETYYSGAVVVHVLNPYWPYDHVGGDRRQQGHVHHFDNLLLEDIKQSTHTQFKDGPPSAANAMQLNTNCVLTNIQIGSTGNPVTGRGIDLNWSPSPTHPTLPAAMFDATTSMTITLDNVNIENTGLECFSDGSDDFNHANYPISITVTNSTSDDSTLVNT